MNAKYIIADSGGSSTNWAIVLQNNEVRFVQTAGLHPKYALSADFPVSGLQEQFQDLHVPLYFYGAGCASETVRQQMTGFLMQLGFSSVEVYPDTLAACRALCGNHSGWVAILGTGSILVHYDGKHITERIGGYGSLVGDEGSGFYFGKLLVRHLLAEKEWNPGWKAVFVSPDFLLSKLAAPDALQWIASLGKVVAGMDFSCLHRKNAELFVETYCVDLQATEISVTGTYGYEQQAVFSEVFERHSIRLKKAVSAPIEDLTRYHQMNE